MVDAKAEAQFRQMQRAFTAQQIPRTVTAADTLRLSDYLVACDATSAGFTLTLPAVKDARGMSFLVVKIDSTANVVTIDGSGSETINGATTQTLTAQWSRAELYCDGTTWYDVAAPQPQIAPWTPIDSSGASLVFTAALGSYEKFGRLVIARGAVTYPVNADVTAALIGGLPFTVGSGADAGQTFVGQTDEATAVHAVAALGGTTISPRTAADATITNATFSTNYFRFCCIYRI